MFKTGDLKWSIDEISKGSKDLEQGRIISLQQALFDAVKAENRIKLDAVVQIHGIPTEVTTVFKINADERTLGAAKDQYMHRKDIEGLKDKIETCIEQGNYMKSVMILVSVQLRFNFAFVNDSCRM